MNSLRLKKDSIFEPRPYEYKTTSDTSNNNKKLKTKTKNWLLLYVLQIIKIACIIFSLLQIFYTGLYLVKKNVHLLSDYPNLVYDVYILLWLLFIVYILPD